MINFNFNHFFKHKLRDSVANLKMTFNAEKRYKEYDGGHRYISSPVDYETVFEDRFKSRFNTAEWGYGQPWGQIHPGDLGQYYDTEGECTYVTKNDGLALELRKKPKKWIKAEMNEWQQSDEMEDEFTVDVCVGLIHSKESWRYGWFEASIKLPEGQAYWPAFWLSGAHSWPPEIDIFEAYSHEGPKYDKPRFFKWFSRPNQRIQPNLHYGSIEKGTKSMYGPRNIPVADATDRFVQYACLWEEDRIEIYYDGIKVFQCTDPKILETYNASDSHQFIILNHGLHHGHPDNPDESAMLVKNVIVKQKRRYDL